MARFNASNIDKYGGQEGTGYFSLKNDRDIAVVRFLYNNEEDIEGYAVHQVEIDGKKRYVNCIREYNQPVDDCPFCKAREFQMAKLFIPVYNVDEDKVQVWERGKKFFSKMSGICSRYGGKNTIVSQTFEIERNGKPGDTQTTYEIYRTDDAPDDTQLEDFEMPQILGGVILDKSYDDMEFYLDNGYFPPEDDNVSSSRRSNRSDKRADDVEEEDERPARRESGSRRAGRRTPSDKF